MEKIEWLCMNFDKTNLLALTNEWRVFFKLRVGDWQIIYKVDWEEHNIIVWIIDKRDKVYKKSR